MRSGLPRPGRAWSLPALLPARPLGYGGLGQVAKISYGGSFRSALKNWIFGQFFWSSKNPVDPGIGIYAKNAAYFRGREVWKRPGGGVKSIFHFKPKSKRP